MTDPAARLAQILEQENAALASFDFPRAIALLTEKQEALRLFGAQPSGTPPARLHDLAVANRRMLERAIAVQGRVIELVASALPQPATSGRYAASGATVHGGPAVAFALLARA